MKTLLCTFATLAACVSACAIRSEDAEAREVGLSLAFPSLQAALVVDVVEVQVLPPSRGCDLLMQDRRTNAPLPQPVVTTGDVNVCSFLSGNAKLVAPLGDHVLLAIARRGNEELFSGCVQQTIGDGDAVLPITLSRSGNAQPDLPATDCASLADLCANRCDQDKR